MASLMSWFRFRATSLLSSTRREVSMSLCWPCFFYVKLKEVSMCLCWQCLHLDLKVLNSYSIYLLWFLELSLLFFVFQFISLAIILGCNQLKLPWYSRVCSVAPERFYLSFKPSCWCSITRDNIFQRNWRRSGVFIVNLEDIAHLLLVFLLLPLSKEMLAWCYC